MEPWAKAYLLALILAGAGLFIRQATGDTLLLTGGLGAALICFVIGTVWLISGAVKKRRKKLELDFLHGPQH